MRDIQYFRSACSMISAASVADVEQQQQQKKNITLISIAADTAALVESLTHMMSQMTSERSDLLSFAPVHSLHCAVTLTSDVKRKTPSFRHLTQA